MCDRYLKMNLTEKRNTLVKFHASLINLFCPCVSGKILCTKYLDIYLHRQNSDTAREMASCVEWSEFIASGKSG